MSQVGYITEVSAMKGLLPVKHGLMPHPNAWRAVQTWFVSKVQKKMFLSKIFTEGSHLGLDSMTKLTKASIFGRTEDQ